MMSRRHANPSVVLQLLAGSCQPLAQWGFRHKSVLAFEEIMCQPPTVAGPSQQGSQLQPHTVILTHGLLGSARNWRTFARKLGESAADKTLQPYRMVLLDLRCHGASTGNGLPPPHNMTSAAADILKFVRHDRFSPPVAILGHSMGGKVLLEVLHQLQASHRATSHQHSSGAGFTLPQAWVLDSQPGKVDIKTDQKTGVHKVLQTVQGLPLPIPSRAWLTQHLKDRGFDAALSAWLGSNVVNMKDGSLGWAFDVHGAVSMYHSYQELEYWNLLACPPPGTAIHLVQGGRSDRWADAGARLQLNHTLAKHREHVATLPPGSCGSFSVHVLPDAGHWLHVDAPAALLQLVLPHICRLSAA